MAGSSNIIQGSLPVFDGKLFDYWKVKMLIVFGFQDVFKLVTIGFEYPGKNATKEQKLALKQQQKLDCKAQFLIYQCVNSKIFNKISKASSSKEA